MRPFVFLSHANPDKKRIASLVEALIRQDIDLWIDKPEEIGLKQHPSYYARIHRIPSGAPWMDQIQAALASAAGVLFIVSNESNSLNRSVELAREFEHGAARNVLVMIQIDAIDHCDLNPFYRSRQIYDLSAMLGSSKPDSATKERFTVVVNQLRGLLESGSVPDEKTRIQDGAALKSRKFSPPLLMPEIEPRLARLKPYLANRFEQQRRVVDALQAHITQKRYRPLNFFAQGTEDDCLDSFVEQVLYTRIPALLASNKIDAKIAYKELRWPGADEIGGADSEEPVLMADLQSQIAEALELPANASKARIEDRLHARKLLWYFYVSLDAESWSKEQTSVLRAWLGWWQTLDHSRFAYPIVTIICAGLPSGIFARLLVPRIVRRMRADLLAIQSDACFDSALHVLPPLKRVHFSDVERWIREYGDGIDREALKKLLSTKFSRTWSLRRRTLSMLEVAHIVKQSLSDPSVRVRNA